MIRRYIELLFLTKEDAWRSKPHGCLENNTTWDLVSDIEKIRTILNIKKWMVFGGSWGSTLALAYSQAHPESVSEMILRGIFMLRQKELDWFYQEEQARYFLMLESFVAIIPHKKELTMVAYNEIFNGNDEDLKLEAAINWSRWKQQLASLSKIIH